MNDIIRVSKYHRDKIHCVTDIIYNIITTENISISRGQDTDFAFQNYNLCQTPDSYGAQTFKKQKEINGTGNMHLHGICRPQRGTIPLYSLHKST